MARRDPLAKLKPATKTLDVDVQGATSIDAIGELAKLETLTLRGFAMNLEPLAKLGKLRHLVLYLDRGVKGLEHLASLTKLRTLTIEESALSDLSICKGMTELVELRVLGGPRAATGIEGACKLTKLALMRTQITSLAPLGRLAKLRELSLRFSRKLRSLKGIEKLNELRELDLFEVKNALSLKPIAKLTKLEGLDLGLTPVKDGDFSPLYKLKRLKGLEADLTSPAQLAGLQLHLPKTALHVDLDEDSDDYIEVGPVKIYEPAGDGPWTIFQDLVDDLEVADQDDVETLIGNAFKKAQPKLFKKVAFDSEGDAFVATSTSRAAIVALAKVIEREIDAVAEESE